MEDKIEILNQKYHIVTEESSNGQLSSKIFLDTPNGKNIIKEVPITSLKKENIEMSMQTFHNKILSYFLKFMNKYRDQSNLDELKSLAEEKLLPKEELTQSKKDEVEEESNSNEIDQWKSLCQQHLPNDILAAYKKKEKLFKYINHEYNDIDDIDDIDFISSIQKYIKNNEKHIVNLVHTINILTFTTDFKHYFVFYLDSDEIILIIAPKGSFGKYVKHVEVFKENIAN